MGIPPGFPPWFDWRGYPATKVLCARVFVHLGAGTLHLSARKSLDKSNGPVDFGGFTIFFFNLRKFVT